MSSLPDGLPLHIFGVALPGPHLGNTPAWASRMLDDPDSISRYHIFFQALVGQLIVHKRATVPQKSPVKRQ
jgi:hypothetical protein